MIRRPPRSTRTDTLFPYTTLFRSELTRLISLTQLAKYIPGNIAQHASRAALSLKRGMPIRPYMSSVIQETLLACAARIIVGLILFAPRLRASGLADYDWLLVLMLLGSGVGRSEERRFGKECVSTCRLR